MKKPNFLYPIIVVAIGALFLFTLPELDDHETQTVVRYQNNFTTDTTAICDSTWHDYGHKPVPDHVWEEIVIVDKPF